MTVGPMEAWKIAFSADVQKWIENEIQGKYLITGSGNGTIKFWNYNAEIS